MKRSSLREFISNVFFNSKNKELNAETQDIEQKEQELPFEVGDFVYLKSVDDRLYEGRMQITAIEYSDKIKEYVALTQGIRGRGMFSFSSLEKG